MTVRGAGIQRHAAVVLAAGEARRFGSPKQLHVLPDGRTMLRAAAETALATGAKPVVVVLGAHRRLVEPSLAGLGVAVVHAAGWAAGPGVGLRLGVERVMSPDPPPGGVLLLAADQPCVTAEDLRGLPGDADPAAAAAADHGGFAGVPAWFGRERVPALRSLPDASGARVLLRDGATRLVPMPSAARDVDTPADAAALSGGSSHPADA